MTTFIVDGKPHTLTLIDPDTGIDWSADFVGNTSHGMSHDAEGNYIATQEDYDWWDRVIEDHRRLLHEDLPAAYARHGRETVDDYLATVYAWSRDLEDQPASVRSELDALDRSAAARALGSIKSERKAAASRANGRKGGRPRK